MAQDEALACRRELGAELRKRREAAGLTGLELAHQVGWSPSRVSRVESGHLGLSEVDLIHYLAFCGVYPRDHGELLAMCRQAERKLGYWLSPHGQGLEDSVRSLIFHEATAINSISYEPHVLPGLLQTEDYARAMVRQYGSRTERNVELCVRARMERQGILRRFSPARFTFFIHEHALRHVVGDLATMHEQLLTVVLLDGLPHVAMRVIPASASFGGAFRLLGFAKDKLLSTSIAMSQGCSWKTRSSSINIRRCSWRSPMLPWMRDTLGSSLPPWQASTTEGANTPVWRKSSFSTGGNTDCVEVAFTGAAASVRDSKNAGGPQLRVPARAWRLLLGHLV